MHRTREAKKITKHINIIQSKAITYLSVFFHREFFSHRYLASDYAHPMNHASILIEIGNCMRIIQPGASPFSLTKHYIIMN